jgi:hypothetical protein
MSFTKLVYHVFQETPVAVFVLWEEETVFADGSGGAFPRELALWEMFVLCVSLGNASGRGDASAGTFPGGLAFLGEGSSVWEPLSCTSSSYSAIACDACCWCAFVCFFSCHVWSKCGRLSLCA